METKERKTKKKICADLCGSRVASCVVSAAVQLDALIGSGLDPGEKLPDQLGFPQPRLLIATEGIAGGTLSPGGRFEASPAPGPSIDSYGCGDSFAAGVTVGLAAGLEVRDAIRLGADAGAACSTWIGPYSAE